MILIVICDVHRIHTPNFREIAVPVVVPNAVCQGEGENGPTGVRSVEVSILNPGHRMGNMDEDLSAGVVHDRV